MKKASCLLSKLQIIVGLGGFCYASASIADIFFDNTPDPFFWSPSIITISAGPAWASSGQNQYLYLNASPINSPALPTVSSDYIYNNYYYYHSPKSVLASGEIFFGLQHLIAPGFIIGELGIGLAVASDVLATGDINMNMNDIVARNPFTYSIDHAQGALKGKLIGNWCLAQPYISASLGVGFNHAHAVVVTNSQNFSFVPDLLTSNTTLAFSYTLGAGLQTKITPHWQVGVGYEFADWGKNALGVNSLHFINRSGLDHLYVNALIISLSSLF